MEWIHCNIPYPEIEPAAKVKSNILRILFSITNIKKSCDAALLTPNPLYAHAKILLSTQHTAWFLSFLPGNVDSCPRSS